MTTRCRMRHLARFIREQRDAIVAAWLQQVRGIPASRNESRAELRDHIPGLLDEIARALDRSDATSPALEEVIVVHARERFKHGYDIREVVAEYQLLRRAIMEAHARTVPTDATYDLAMLNEVIDLAIGVSVDCFMTERDRARDIFVGILGHDLRGPLGAILAAAEILTSATDPSHASIVRVGTRVRRSVTRMTELINGLLDFARTHFGGGIPIDAGRTDLRPLIRDVVEELAMANPTRTIICHARDATGDFVATVDSTRVAQAISNLVRNAVEHGRDPIVVTPVDETSAIRIDVSSAGTIARETVSQLFKPFAHVTRTSTNARSGLGLGLFIVAEIARAHGGTAWVEPNEGESRVTFSFRMRRDQGTGGANEV